MMNIFFAYGFRANYEVVGDLILAAALLASGVSDGGRWEAARPLPTCHHPTLHTKSLRP
ncbi:MAG: hypothetical protein JO031_11910 [Ktedonobacteraceae bacterium]|nr:hypothetical protein [Ktedonobacteraceae bacterium]